MSAISSAVSILLVVTYLRLVVNLRFAVAEAGLSQLIYLVLFSYAFFFEGFTGLAITIGAILTPQLEDMRHAQSLPYASSLCGACYEVCPVKINIPEVLVYLRSRVVDRRRRKLASLIDQERIGMMMMAAVFANRRRYEAAQRSARIAQKTIRHGEAWYHWLPGMAGRWTETRDLAPLPQQTFREWWQHRGQS